jgi:hypothetical protein
LIGSFEQSYGLALITLFKFLQGVYFSFHANFFIFFVFFYIKKKNYTFSFLLNSDNLLFVNFVLFLINHYNIQLAMWENWLWKIYSNMFKRLLLTLVNGHGKWICQWKLSSLKIERNLLVRRSQWQSWYEDLLINICFLISLLPLKTLNHHWPDARVF